MGYLTTEGQIVTTYDPSSLLRVKQRPRTRHCGPVDRSNCSERQERATCVVGGQEHSGTGYYVFTMGTGHSRPPSRRNDRDTHHTLELRPRGFAQPNGTPSPTFLPTAGCRQAQTTQHSQLTAINQLRRARRPDTTSRPRRSPSPHSTAAPPHLKSPGLGPVSVPACPCPGGRSTPAPQPPRAPSRPPKRRENPPSGADRRRRLRTPASQQRGAH